MPKRVEALVSPNVLKWARESTALTPEEAARAAGIGNPAKLLEAESGERKITFRQLKALAKAFRLPLRVMYLPDPPDEREFPIDFRSVTAPSANSPTAIRAICMARERRAILIELLAEQRHDTPDFPETRTDDDIILQLTPLFCVPELPEDLRVPPAGAGALNVSKSLAEKSLPVAIFETPRNLDWIRRSSLYDPPLSVIILNSRDSPNARRFTLAHELAHLFMRESGICDPLDDNNATERRCNRIAGDSMLPPRLLEERLAVPGDAEGKISDLARDFRMSHSAVAVRLQQVGALSQRRLRELLDHYQRQYNEQREIQSEAEGGPNYYLMQTLRLGSKFTAAVLEGYADGALSTSQAADLLGVTPSFNSIKAIQERAAAAYDR